jgi:hypothetical protein
MGAPWLEKLDDGGSAIGQKGIEASLGAHDRHVVLAFVNLILHVFGVADGEFGDADVPADVPVVLGNESLERLRVGRKPIPHVSVLLGECHSELDALRIP